VKAAERADRDKRVLELFIGGSNYREIAAVVGLTIARVEVIVKRELADAAKRRLMLTDEALAIHQERTERLFKSQFVKALEGDARAAEICERMLARNARLFGLAEEINPAPLPAPTQTVTPPAADGDGDGEPKDELARLRAARTSS